MAKGLNKILNAKNIDMFIEIVDARAINVSSNPNLIATKKPILKIALKGDLAETNKNKNTNVMIGTIKNAELRNQIMRKLYSLMGAKIQKAKSLGLLNPTFHVMVVGLPNVGKSSLINFLSASKTLVTKNLPGVTKKNTLKKINKDFFLYDTPGILMKNIERTEDGFRLALIGVIKKQVLPIDEVIEYAFNFYMKNYRDKFASHYNVPLDNYLAFLAGVAQKYNFFRTGGKIDMNRTYDYIYDEIINGKICNVNYEK
jgi:ribosome biogenesis GTPase A